MADDSELLLYSLNEFREIIRRALEIIRPERVLEVGGEAGHFTRTLVEWANELEFEVVVVEPEPSPALRVITEDDHVRLIEGKSPEGLAVAGPCDVYLLDGDHNFHTLKSELAALREICSGRPYLAVLHDVGWPWARRDLYYAPHELSPRSMHSPRFDAGVGLGSTGVVAWGFRGLGEFAVAREEGGRENGVFPAIEEFLQSAEGFRFLTIPCVFGLGFLFSEDAPWSQMLHAEIRPYHENALLARMEQNRLALYLRVLQLQDSLFATKRDLERTRAEREEQIEDLTAELLKMMEALALVDEDESKVDSEKEPHPRALRDDSLRVLSYDLYRAQVKARRVAGRLKRTLSGR